jgi:hypothetical protein
MSLVHLARAALAMPPRAAAAKAVRFAGRLLKDRLLGRLMRRQCSYPSPTQIGGALNRRLARLDPTLLARHGDDLRRLAAQTCRHHFDLLGSGPVRVAHGEPYAGFDGHHYGPGEKLKANWRSVLAGRHWRGNALHAAMLLSHITDPSYVPIDWQVDFKSGYRWSERSWGGGIPYAHKPGIDVKVPWELARLQHLPALALAFAAGGNSRLADEFHNQVLDFLASNPPGWGVNWACAMDVAIRAANLALAWDLFRAHGAAFPEFFEEELGSALLAHGRHIAHNLEWNPHHRGNHYLADICGLAFIAAALPRSTEADLWLVFATQQLDAEILRQFGPDGGNFEASTAYHRLSTEMALFTVALILGLPTDKRDALTGYDATAWGLFPKVAPAPMAWPPFSPATLERLARATRFAADVTKPSGEIVQIGDNDSGRFFKLTPSLDSGGRERVLDLSHLWQGDTIDAAIMTALAGGTLSLPATEPARTLTGAAPDQAATHVTRVVVTPEDPAALDELECLAYPDFGLFIWKNARAFVSVRCGPIGGNGLGAHAHNDQLAVEIEIDGIAFARDPGTFVYTPDLAARNAYRSAAAHVVPRCGANEPARLDLGPFRLEDRAQARSHRFADGEFLGSHQGFGETVWRRVLVSGGAVVIEDCRGGPEIGRDTQVEEHLANDPAIVTKLWRLELPFSPGYGFRER